MKMKKKGQGALEYLMTYGWALLIIVVVAAALYALGVLNPATYSQSRCTGLTYFTWQNQKADHTNGYTVEVRNGPQKVTIGGLSFGGVTNSTSTTVTVDGVAPTGFIDAGKVIVISMSGIPAGKISGDSFSNEIMQVTYHIQSGIQGNVDTAQCSGKYA